MLMSADWFRSAWPLMGFVFTGRAGDSVQRAAQAAVKTMMADATTYWFRDIRESRVIATYEGFFASLESSGVSRADVERLKNALTLSEGTSDDQAESASEFLFGSALHMLIKSDPAIEISSLSLNLRTKIIEGVNEFDPTEPDPTELFDELARKSETPWDRYLKSLTPDMPEFTSTHANTLFRHQRGFRLIWSVLQARLSPDELNQLRAWLLEQANKLVNHSFTPHVPMWMNI